MQTVFFLAAGLCLALAGLSLAMRPGRSGPAPAIRRSPTGPTGSTVQTSQDGPSSSTDPTGSTGPTGSAGQDGPPSSTGQSNSTDSTDLTSSTGPAGTPAAGMSGRLYAFFLAAAGVVLAAGLAEAVIARLLVEGLPALLSPIQRNPMEGREVVRSLLFLDGHALYGDLNDYPLLISLYGPVYATLSAGLYLLAGPSLAVSRLLTMAGAVGLCLLTYQAVVRETGSRPAALGAAALLFVQPTMEYGFMARPDVLAWFFLFAGSAAFCRAAGDAAPRRGTLALAAALATLAVYTKQQTWVFVPALALWGLWRGQVRKTLFFAAVTAGLGLAVLAGLQYATDGRFFLQTVVFPKRMAELADLNKTAFALERLSVFWTYNAAPVCLYAVALAYRLATRSVQAIDVMLAVFLPFLFVVLRWDGAEYNHFLSVTVILAMSLGLLAGSLAKAGPYGPLLALAAFWLVVPMPQNPLPAIEAAKAGLARHRERAKELGRLYEATGGRLLMDAESAYLAVGREAFGRVSVYDAFETDIFDKTGLWDASTSPLLRDAGRRAFSLVATNPLRQPAGLESLLRDAYVRLDAGDAPRLHRPRPETHIAFVADPAAAPPAEGLVRDVAMDNLDAAERVVTSDGREGRGTLTVRLRTPRPVKGLGVAFYPRLNEADPAALIEVAVSGDGLAFTPIRTVSGGAGTGWGGIFGQRVEVSGAADGAAPAVRFTLRGPAQLWSDKLHPFVVYLDEKAPAD